SAAAARSRTASPAKTPGRTGSRRKRTVRRRPPAYLGVLRKAATVADPHLAWAPLRHHLTATAAV
ncbi:hypothetical protein, partial [Streptomyces spectabilis]|uniref:hypothetical protein n=1 Tax=Streptomyces spectabilis TaxID=68270 RepID=UPI0033CF4A05